ncbi:DISARM system helicase DrmA [Ktedonobacter robiniae]|uniref:Helicase n=1 Tax=Ktedonobacter robiniae TaxID=2778365 RepID=A0ABQ3UTN7_9CHLR|nr:DISARM system helicase DrmA [Ktedonobacter robiniae]GHO56056.1 helicase [Ktedonobacter robiniae]
MQSIRLPEQLPNDPQALAALNQQLRDHTISLDWSDVKLPITSEQLAALFQDMALADYVEDLDNGTMSESVLPVVLAHFEKKDVVDEGQDNPEAEQPAGSVPDVWLPEKELTPIVDEEGDPLSATVISKKPSPKIQKEDTTPLLEAPTQSAIRDELEEMVLRDLLGPAGGENEELDHTESRVRDRYLVGMLAPMKVQTQPEELDSLTTLEEGKSEENTVDADVAQMSSLSPSSMGLSFCVEKQTTALLVTASWGQYQRTTSEFQNKANGEPYTVWRRTPRGGTSRQIPLQPGHIVPWSPEEEEQPEVHVKGLIRDIGDGWMITLFLVNGQKEPERLRDQAWLFQPELVVEAPDGSPVFQRRANEQQKHYTKEEKAMAMLYRQHVSFAIGHGVSVHAETSSDDPTCAVRISTRIVPEYDVPRTDAPTAAEVPALAGLCLDMRELAETPVQELSDKLQPLITAYGQWIEEQEQRINNPASGLASYEAAARDALKGCNRTLFRIQTGIQQLQSSDEAAQAFAFMNRAMWQQRIHTLYAEERRKGHNTSLEDVDQSKNRSWRPFQLAFILLNLPSLTDLNHPNRSESANAIADLLWFPTGGGKTEAYLGLTAYTLAIRRLQGTVEGRSGMDGVAVIMRYTLRLLTLQQFQRAASLICACEIIRCEDPATWGSTPFRLGLWVGMRSTPNTTEQSKQANELAHGVYNSGVGGIGSPRQLTSCPWCGTLIEGGKHIKVEPFNRGRGRTLIYCGDNLGQCPFSERKSPEEGLPVVVVDEEIYRLLPALLIATVDKFAQLPWRGTTQMLFGQVNQKCSRHGFRSPDLEDKDAHPAFGKLPRATSTPHAPLRPPDLIIQDELHLISGPLGTLVGLYETAVDHLATWEVNGKKVRPKVIAATATIRRAEYQLQALFLRKVNIFPPQGLDVGDNFFSRQRTPSEETPGRRYLGICANGRRLKAAIIRVYAAYLSAAQALYNKYGAAVDPWMTLVGYFNSMSELGGTRRLVEDDVRMRIWRMNQRGLAQRKRPIVEELTSRKSSSVIPEILGRLEVGFGSEGEKPIDVLLATNMISVGVDVRRLGLMVVTGQPKTTAEYIQATSRVGRTFPGLVCTVFNWARPRDLSHYEQFEHYHATFYQQVEALSVTPFAPRALDRGLAALLTSFVRLSGPEYNKNEEAGDVTDETPYFEQARQAIARRAEEITNNDDGEVDRVQSDLERLKHYWVHKAQTVPVLGYEARRDGKTQELLKQPERGNWEPFTCLNSLRDVEPTVRLIFDERPIGGNNDSDDDNDTATGEQAAQ